MSAFTPGPWKSCRDDYALVRIVDEGSKKGGLVICQVFGFTADNVDANAALLAEAPALLSALKNLLHSRGRGCQCLAVEACCGPGQKCDECVAREVIDRAELCEPGSEVPIYKEPSYGC